MRIDIVHQGEKPTYLLLAPGGRLHGIGEDSQTTMCGRGAASGIGLPKEAIRMGWGLCYWCWKRGVR